MLKNGFAPWNSFTEAADVSRDDVWKIENGVLACHSTQRGYLYTKKDYTDFILTLQWRWPEGAEPGKGGVLVRMSGAHCIWPTSLEAQLNAGDAGDFWGLAGYHLEGPEERTTPHRHETFGQLINVKKTKKPEKAPGEWNIYSVTAKGGDVVITLNGEEVNRAQNCDVTAGPICLTAEGSPIEFRRIFIKECIEK